MFDLPKSEIPEVFIAEIGSYLDAVLSERQVNASVQTDLERLRDCVRERDVPVAPEPAPEDQPE